MPYGSNTNAPGNISSGQYQRDGVTALVWGTGNSFGSYIVISIDENEKTETYYVENGTGIEATRVLLKHGTRWNVTVVDDVSLTPPIVGNTVTVWKHSISNGANTTSNAVVLSNDVRAARKQEGQRVLQLENLTLADT